MVVVHWMLAAAWIVVYAGQLHPVHLLDLRYNNSYDALKVLRVIKR